MAKPQSKTALLTVRIAAIWRRRWVRWTVAALSVPAVLLFFAAGYYYVTFARLIDARLHGERERVFPRVFARPLELRRGQSLTDRQLIDRLNDLGYAQRGNGGEAGRVLNRRRRGLDHAARRGTARGRSSASCSSVSR